MTHRLLPVLLLFACVIAGCAHSTEDVLPPPRSGFGFAFDQTRQELVVFGGSDSSNVRLSDTWTWSDGEWTHHDVDGPSPRSDMQIAYHAAREQTVMFGGLTDDGLANDTWGWDGTNWALLDTTGPSVRQLTVMAYDATREEVVLFGGSGPSRARLDDTWIWNGSTWREAEPEVVPSARGAHQMAFDHGSQKITLVGGWDTATATDTWQWDGGSWSVADTTSTPPRLHGSMAYDNDLEALVLFGGFGESGRENSIWAFMEGSWSALTTSGPVPEIRAEHDGAYHPELGYVTFGGVVGDGMALADRGKTNALWSFRNGIWTEN